MLVIREVDHSGHFAYDIPKTVENLFVKLIKNRQLRAKHVYPIHYFVTAAYLLNHNDDVADHVQ